MKKITILFIMGIFSLALAQGPQTGEYDPGFQTDSTGKVEQMNFDIPLTSISDPGMLFSHFTSRPLLIYYFSPKCPHCLTTYPQVQAIVDRYASNGLSTILVSVGSAKKNDIRGVINNLNIPFPVFQDGTGQFSDHYGSGYVPLIVLVTAEGQFIRYTQNGHGALVALEKDIREVFSLDPQ